MAECLLDIINHCCAPLDSCLQFSVIYQKKEEVLLFYIIIKYNTGKKLISHNMHSNTKIVSHYCLQRVLSSIKKITLNNE